MQLNVFHTARIQNTILVNDVPKFYNFKLVMKNCIVIGVNQNPNTYEFASSLVQYVSLGSSIILTII